ncbi:MAG: J domain-containing protein [Cyanobacteria bacterium P01_D01_bin.105]
MSESPGDYYQRLRLPPNASRQEIRDAFRRLARQYHPDLHPNQPGAIKKFRGLREAYEVLMDRVQRQHYDQHCDQCLDERQLPLQTDNPSALAKPQTPEAFYMRGVRYTLSRRFRAALGDYSKAIELDPQFAEAYLRRAEVCYLLEDDSGVLADCQRAIALNSTEAKTYFYQGMARYRLDYVQSAIAAFTDAITCDPDDAQYYYRRGLAYQDLHQMDAAAKDLRRAAHLYRNQGNLGSYEQIHQYLRQFGCAGRSLPIKLLSHTFSRVSMLRPSARKKLSHRQANHPNPARRQNRAAGTGHATPHSRQKHSRQKQTYWAPGVSSRPSANAGLTGYASTRGHLLGNSAGNRAGNLFSNLVGGMGNILRLLSNPAGEMVPLYLQLSPQQTALVGYGLAVFANLLFISGGIHYTTANSWLVASWLWAAGGMTFVAMVTVVALARILLRIRGLWVADIFTLATALVPLGMLSVLGAITQQLAIQYLTAANFWMANTFVLLCALWALSHTLLTIYSGFSRIHTFPDRLSAWLTPTVVVLGLMAGVGTWGVLSL